MFFVTKLGILDELHNLEKDSREWPIIVLKFPPFLKITQFSIIDHLLQLYNADHQFDQNYY